MKIIPTEQIKNIDSFTIEHDQISSIDLMERSAKALMDEIAGRWQDLTTRLVVFAGPGNNGGDALALSRMLAEKGYKPEVYLFNVTGGLSDECEENRDRLSNMENITFTEITKNFTPPVLTPETIIIDGLFGSGLNKPLSKGFAALAKYFNNCKSTVVSIDIPSGLMGEDNNSNEMSYIVRADLTLSLQLPKLAFLFPENEKYVGDWRLLDIGLSKEAIDSVPTNWELLDAEDVPLMIKERNRFAHKGMFGRALLVAGSRGMAGASVLAAKGCMKSGVGLLTVHVPQCNNTILQISVPEATTSIDSSDECFTEIHDINAFQAIGVGPGLGTDERTREALLDLIDESYKSSKSKKSKVPLVLDADALNLIGENLFWLGRLPEGSVITPHIGEFDRMVGVCRNSYERLEEAIKLSNKYGVHIILKGAYTAIITPDGKCVFNGTGNPGMATGGSGDVLTGVLTALLAQGYDTATAAKLGVYVHGLAGDIAARRKGKIGMTALDIAESLPEAWKLLEEQ